MTLISAWFIAICAVSDIQLELVKDEAGRVSEVVARGMTPKRSLESADDSPADFQRYLAVFVAESSSIRDLPAMQGTYRAEKNALRFRPKFPFRSGLRFRVEADPDGRLTGNPASGPLLAAIRTLEFAIPAEKAGEPARVLTVYPTADVLPENLLRFYIEFSAPMQRGDIYRHIRLLDADNEPIDLPFLEIGEELWDPEGKRLTLLIDPGRIKRGVKPLEDIGPVLESGKSYTLIVDRAWRDGFGQPMSKSFRKRFSAGAPNRTALDTRQWKWTLPAPGSREPLVLRFPWPLDARLLQRTISVATEGGVAVDGRPEIGDREQSWSWRPDSPWPDGPFQLVVDTTLEDPVGNRIGRAFELDQLSPLEKRIEVETVQIPFQLRKP